MNPGAKIDMYNVAQFLGDAHSNALIIKNIQNSFKAVEIFPFDNNVFMDADFLPSRVQENSTSVTEGANGELMASNADKPTTSTAPANSDTGIAECHGEIGKKKSPEMIRPYPSKESDQLHPAKGRNKKRKSTVFTLSPMV